MKFWLEYEMSFVCPYPENEIEPRLLELLENEWKWRYEEKRNRRKDGESEYVPKEYLSWTAIPNGLVITMRTEKAEGGTKVRICQKPDILGRMFFIFVWIMFAALIVYFGVAVVWKSAPLYALFLPCFLFPCNLFMEFLYWFTARKLSQMLSWAWLGGVKIPVRIVRKK